VTEALPVAGDGQPTKDTHMIACIPAEEMPTVMDTLPNNAESNAASQATVLKVVAHDLRTPVTSIWGYVDLMQREMLGPITEEQRKALDRIVMACLFVNRLVDDLLDTAAATTGTLTLHEQEFSPADIAYAVVELCRPQALAQGLSLHVSSAGAPASMIGDPDRVQQVLFNLLSNALRYTQQGSVQLVMEGDAAEVEFRIEDTGPGIPAAIQEDIWQLNRRGVAQGPGFGLGLYVVRLLVEAMGGSAGVRSAVGQGSAFWVRLPLHATASDSAFNLRQIANGSLPAS